MTTRNIRAITRSCIKAGGNFQPSTSASAQTSRGNAAWRVINDSAAANGVSRSRLMWSWSALATLGVTSVNSVGSGNGSALRVAGTSMASTAAIALMAPLILPYGADAARAAGKGSGDDDDKRDGKARGLLGFRIFGGDEGGDKKDAKVGKGMGGLNKEQEDNVKKMASDLKDALKGFGDNINKAVDGAIHSNSGDEPGLISDAKKKINEMVEKGMPAQMSFGFIMRVCCGFAAKKHGQTAKAALVGIGLAFGSLQLLSYLGYVELDYKTMEGEVTDALDLDQDGKVNTGDVQELFDRTMKVMAYNLPAGSGSAAGAVVGA